MISFTQQKKLAKQIKDSLELNEILSEGDNFAFLLNFFKEHPNYDEKFENGCVGFIKREVIEWGKSNSCLHIIDEDLREKTISVNYTKTINKASEVTKAFRDAIHPTIKSFKNKFIPGETKCEISNKILYDFYNVDVDHHNLDFVEIVFEFMKNRSFEELYKFVVYDKTITKFANEKIKEDFINFHNDNTTLRFVDRAEHKKKIRLRYERN